jgi:hypothetical protein
MQERILHKKSAELEQAYFQSALCPKLGLVKFSINLHIQLTRISPIGLFRCSGASMDGSSVMTRPRTYLDSF